MFRIHRCTFATPDEAVRKILDDRECDGYEEESDGGGKRHAADDHSAQDAPGGGARAAGRPQRQTAEDEGQGCHYDGAEAQARGVEGGLADTLTTLIVDFCELDDEDSVLGR